MKLITLITIISTVFAVPIDDVNTQAYLPNVYPVLNLKTIEFLNTSKLHTLLPVNNLKLTFTPLKVANSTNFRSSMIGAGLVALPQLDSQLKNSGKPGLKPAWTAQAFADAAIKALGGTPIVQRDQELQSRDIFSDIGCGLFAAGALPAFLAAAAWFAVGNQGAPIVSSLSNDQQFFERAVHGNYPQFNLIYSANFPPFFGGAAATTIGHNVYFKKAQQSTDVAPNSKWGINSNFADRTSIIIHETQHVKQFDNDGNIVSFGYNYLYEFCQAGFSYKNDAYEAQAYSVQATANALFGGQSQFFKIWKGANLQPKIGFPGTVDVYTGGFMWFTNGMLQIRSTADPNIREYRYLVKGSTNYNAFSGAQCNPNRKVTPPSAKPCLSDDPPLSCDSDWIFQQNQECKAKQLAWSKISVPWTKF